MGTRTVPKENPEAPTKTVLTERIFKMPNGYEESEAMPGIGVTPEYKRFSQALFSGVADQSAAADLTPNAKLLSDELAVVHLPEAKRGELVKAPPTRFTIKQADRLAKYLVERGVSIDPDKAVTMWVPTPNNGPGDHGVHVTRNQDGTWPTPDPEDFYDIEKVKVSQTQDGWAAAHPCGVVAEAPTKSQAHAEAVKQLMVHIEQARKSAGDE